MLWPDVLSAASGGESCTVPHCSYGGTLLRMNTFYHFIIFLLLLQEAERDSIQLQEQLNGLQEEKERLLNSLVEAEYVPLPMLHPEIIIPEVNFSNPTFG